MAIGWRNDYTRYRRFFLNIVDNYRSKPDGKAFLEIGFSLVAVTIFSAFAIRPTIITIIDLHREIAAKRQILETMETKINNLNIARSVYENQRENIALLDTAVPSDPSVDQLTRQIEGLTQKHSTALSSFTVGNVVLLGSDQETVEGEQVEQIEQSVNPLPQSAESVPFAISVRNVYETVRNFFTDAENLRRPAKIDTIRLETSQEDDTIILFINGRSPYLENEQN